MSGVDLPDPIGALVAVLKADPTVSQLTDLVFGAELPAAENTAMPQQCVVIKPSGGAQQLGGGYQQFSDQRVDVFCYGETPHAAYTLHTAVRLALKQLQRTSQGKTLLHWCRTAGGPLNLRDPKTEWPYTISSFQVLASEIALA